MFDNLMDKLDREDIGLPGGFSYWLDGGVKHHRSGATTYRAELLVYYPDGSKRHYPVDPGQARDCADTVAQAIREAQAWAELAQAHARRLAEDEAGDAHAYTGNDEILR